MARPLTVLHASDLQCGAPFLPEGADALVRLHEAVKPDVVVVAGDLTQRAKGREFRTARRLLDRFAPVPVIVTPGNHDVPLYRIWERPTVPFRNWRRFTGHADLDTVTRVEDATFVALASAAPRRAIVNGRIDVGQVEFARAAFEDAPAGDLRLLVVHHHFAPVPSGEGGKPLPRADRLARTFAEMGVDAVLGGHVHQLHLSSFQGIPFLATGTATSRRGRGAEAGWNSVCVHRFGDDAVETTPWFRAPGGRDFEAREPVTFELPTGTGVTGEARR